VNTFKTKTYASVQHKTRPSALYQNTSNSSDAITASVCDSHNIPPKVYLQPHVLQYIECDTTNSRFNPFSLSLYFFVR